MPRPEREFQIASLRHRIAARRSDPLPAGARGDRRPLARLLNASRFSFPSEYFVVANDRQLPSNLTPDRARFLEKAISILEQMGALSENPSMRTVKNPNGRTRQERIDHVHRCHPGRTALLVVDMQHGFLDPGASLEVPKGRELVPAVRGLIECCRAVEIPVVFTQFVYSEAIPCLRGDPFGIEHLPARAGHPKGFGHPSSNCLVGSEAGQGAESAEVVPDLAPLPGELIVASYCYDKFLDTPLDLALRCRGITHLFVTGVTTDVCVNCTVLAAANRDYRVTVVTDGVATIDEEIHEACLAIWRRKFARLRTTAEVIAELKRGRRNSRSRRT